MGNGCTRPAKQPNTSRDHRMSTAWIPISRPPLGWSNRMSTAWIPISRPRLGWSIRGRRRLPVLPRSSPVPAKVLPRSSPVLPAKFHILLESNVDQHRISRAFIRNPSHVSKTAVDSSETMIDSPSKRRRFMRKQQQGTTGTSVKDGYCKDEKFSTPSFAEASFSTPSFAEASYHQRNGRYDNNQQVPIGTNASRFVEIILQYSKSASRLRLQKLDTINEMGVTTS